MEFALSPQFNFDMGMNMNPSLGFLEEEDDEFYAEMRRQIMILTGDYDDFPETKIVKPSYSSVTNPRSSSSISSSQGSMSFWQNEYRTTESVAAAPVQPVKSSGISTGTGVFIPISNVKARRNSKRRGKVNDRKFTSQWRTSSDHEASY